jgi:PAS domain S-box-containing protein
MVEAPAGAAPPGLDLLPCAIVSFRDDGSVAYVNAEMLSLLGHQRADVEGKHVEGLLTIPGKIFFQTHLYPLIRLAQPANELFVLLRHRDGRAIGTLMNARRRDASNDSITDCVFVEVRERGKFEEALLRMKQDLERANRALRERGVQLEEASQAKTQFLAVMSHELRTPLNAIGGYVQLMEMEVQGPITHEQKESLARITRAQRHLLRLINEILDLSRIEAGHVEYTIEEFGVGGVIESVMPMLEPQIVGAGLEAAVNVAPALLVCADREKVQQILINLLTNAVKFTPPGGRITVSARRTDGSVIVSVTDSGIGIAADKLESVFEPFVQVRSNHRSAQGTGLGLTISRNLARGMQGDLAVESTQGKGSTFSLRLPVGSAAAQE